MFNMYLHKYITYTMQYNNIVILYYELCTYCIIIFYHVKTTTVCNLFLNPRIPPAHFVYRDNIQNGKMINVKRCQRE